MGEEQEIGGANFSSAEEKGVVSDQSVQFYSGAVGNLGEARMVEGEDNSFEEGSHFAGKERIVGVEFGVFDQLSV